MTPAAHSDLADLFTKSAQTFTGSPLYQELARTVAVNEVLLGLAAQCQPGHRPPNVMFAAVHRSVRRHPDRPLAQWYASVVGLQQVRDPAEAGPVFIDYCRQYEDELLADIRTRYVQTNVVKRAAGLRFGLSRVASRTTGPVALVEIGCSAGVLLRHDAYAYRAGEHHWGSAESSVKIDFDWRSDGPTPDLDALPVIMEACGIDLNPINPVDPSEREWLEALVWPENLHEAALLSAALDVVSAHPPTMISGDAIEVLPELVKALPDGLPVVIFHSFARAHVPRDRRPQFDAVIDDVATSRRLFHLSMEGSRDPRYRDHVGAMLLQLSESGPGLRASAVDLGLVEQHGEWILPL